MSAAPAFANNLLLIPTGNTLSTGQFRAEAALSPDNTAGRYYWFGTGLQQLEVNLIRYEKHSGEDENLIGLQWSFLPETMLTPGISFGARDIAMQSAEGIGVYAAISKHLPIGKMSPVLKDLSVTAGIGAAGIRGPFFGFEASLPYRLFAEGEYDSRDFNGAVGWQPSEHFRLKAYAIRREFYLGAELVPAAF